MNETILTALIFFVLFSLAGWGMIGIDISTNRKTRAKLEVERARTTGAIVDYAQKTVRMGRNGRVRTTYAVVEYIAEGQTFRQGVNGYLDSKVHPVGSAVEVLYDADDPSHFHLEEEAQVSHRLTWFGLAWIAVCAAVALVIVFNPFVGFRARHVMRETGITDVFYGGGSQSENTETIQIASGVYTYTAQADATAVITGYTGTDERLSIPTFLDGHVVAGIGISAFSRCDGLISLTVPGFIPSIPAGGFAACPALAEVDIGDGVRTIGNLAFSFCPSLRDVALPASLVSIADDAFPADCGATFRVPEGSEAERYCRKKGFKVEVVL